MGGLFVVSRCYRVICGDALDLCYVGEELRAFLGVCKGDWDGILL